MRFKRGQDAKDALKIGRAAVAIEMLDILLVYYNDVTGQNNGMANMGWEDMHNLLKRMSTNKLSKNEVAKIRKKYRPRRMDRSAISWNTLFGKIIKLQGEYYELKIPKGHDIF